MRYRLVRWLVVGLLLAAAGIAGWLLGNKGEIERRRALHRLRAAENYDAAQRELAWFEGPPDAERKRLALVEAWGQGDAQLDLHVARFVGEPGCSEDLRRQFAERIGRDQRSVERWGHYWSWKSREEPAREAAHALSYFKDLTLGPPRPITWREALDLQALFALTDESTLALGLSPENWRDRIGLWLGSSHARVDQIKRPEGPLPDLEAAPR